MNKIAFRKRKRVSKFYFKLINNLLSNNYFVSKKNKTPGNVHMQNFYWKSRKIISWYFWVLECTAYMQDNCFVFDAKWKHIVTGFFLRNEITAMYN